MQRSPVIRAVGFEKREGLIAIVGQLERQQVGFKSLHEKLDTATTTTGGMSIFHVFVAFAEFIRTIIVANTNDGLAAAEPAASASAGRR